MPDQPSPGSELRVSRIVQGRANLPQDSGRWSKAIFDQTLTWLQVQSAKIRCGPRGKLGQAGFVDGVGIPALTE
jgi:hypothetical protein